ncbi:hypothetical protein PputUW4_03128 [Pseudomonas sp. UW4]|nr:hypothetical protein PputUW4_03128 [Pseudomonas sp. UW4]
MLARSRSRLPQTGLIHRCNRAAVFRSRLKVGASPYIGASLLAMDSSAPRLSSSPALSLTTIASKLAPTP